ncbi:MAG: twin-arginine translocase subunit TatC [Planctomycetales bacterium]|nr:twin-arginine translocase subunit TatC [Planctomycetales bacterium]
MSYDDEDDLFADTKMSFGEHLEELRAALFKAIVALAIGAVLGLSFGNEIVQRIQDPLTAALERYYENKEIGRYHERLQQQLAAREEMPEELRRLAEMPLDDARDELLELMGADRMIPRETFIHPGQLVRELKRHDPQAFGELPDVPYDSAAINRETMIRIYLWHPLKSDPRISVKALSAQEAFMIFVKASLLAGAILASPFMFYFIWAFVASGLYPHEKHYVYIFGPFSLVLFVAGAALAFFVVFDYVLDFLFGINAWVEIDPDMRISEWMSFALLMPIGFGISFQLPLVMLFLERIGIFAIRDYIDKWQIAVLVISIISMLLTPADPMSMLLMAIPLTALYFGGIALCRYMPKRKGPFRDRIE